MNKDQNKSSRPRRPKGAGLRPRSVSTADKRHVIVHKLHGEQNGFVKFKWNDDSNDFVGSQISDVEGKRLLSRQYASFCRPSDVEGKKFYCYFDAEHNQPFCILVDNDDPRCS